MAINPAVKGFINEHQGRWGFCHQATYSLFTFARFAERKVQDISISAQFSLMLECQQDLGKLYDAKTAVPPHLYDVMEKERYCTPQ